MHIIAMKCRDSSHVILLIHKKYFLRESWRERRPIGFLSLRAHRVGAPELISHRQRPDTRTVSLRTFLRAARISDAVLLSTRTLTPGGGCARPPFYLPLGAINRARRWHPARRYIIDGAVVRLANGLCRRISMPISDTRIYDYFFLFN